MNYKQLFPTYRGRFLFIKECLARYSNNSVFDSGLHLGTGEGDYDFIIAEYCQQLTACDINENDIAYAKKLNAGLTKVEYHVEDANSLTYKNQQFDLIVSVDVIEHVDNPEKMVEEMSRVIKPGGFAFITYPQINFPWLYDPINKVLSTFTKYKLPIGAYAYGHNYLIDGKELSCWLDKNGLVILEEQRLGGYLVSLFEMYWPGIIQKIFKENAGNLPGKNERKVMLRPSIKEPFLTKLTDALINLDSKILGNSKYSVGKGVVVQKKSTQV